MAMIKFQRTGSIAPGKLSTAVAWAKEIAAYVKEKHGVEVTVSMPVGGNPNRLCWAAFHENLGDFEALQLKLMADPKYLEIAVSGAENLIAGSLHDDIWRSI
jgi:hypothetical protein